MWVMISLLRRSVLFFTVLSFVQVLIFLPVHAQIYSNGFEGGGIPGTTSFTGGATGDPNLNIATSNWSTSGVFTTFTGNAPTATTSMALQPATALTTNWTLTVPVNAGYSANITGIKLDYRSTGTSYTGLSITVNGTSVYVNNTLNTTSTWVTVPITGLTLTGITGNISVVCVLSGGTHGGASTFRFDNFSITGNVIPTNNPPVFTGSVIQALSVCQNSSATSINSLMSINDLDVGQTETWTINSGPTNGSLIGFSASGTSTGGTITPVGLTYTPSPGFSGSDAFSIKISDGIASATTTVNVTVTPIPVPTTIAGVQNVCAGANTPLSNIVSGGVWSSATTTVATIGPSGIVYGITAGNSAISYTVTNGCGVAVSTTTVTVDPLPIAGIISGTSSVCVGAITSLSSTASGGIWSSATTSIATVSNIGDVTGVNAGNSIISYSVTNGCGTDVTTATVTVRPLAVAGTITGVTVFCLRAMTSISDAITGGVWSSGNTNIATVSGSGGVTGVNAGISVISYSVTNGCGTTNATTTINVLPLPSVFPLGGGGNYCSGGIGMHIMLNSSEPGINYQLYYGSAATGSVVAGTGGIIDFGLQTAAGTYTV